MCSKKRVGRNPNSRRDHPAHVLTLARDHVERRRGPEIHHDARAAVLLERSHAVDDAVGAHLRRIVVVHRHAGLDAGFDEQRARVEVALAHLAQGGVQRRHHRRNHDALHRADLEPVHGKQVAEEDAVLVHHLRLDGGNPPVREQAASARFGGLGLENAQHRIGIAYVDDQAAWLISR